MRLRLLKSYTMNTGKKLPVGSVFGIIREVAKQLIAQEIAEPYNDRMPPLKAKTEFFKPKTKRNKKWQQQEQ
jgi:hypothetical protein